MDEVVSTFTSPMAWLLVVALIITWSAVAIVLFDLLDYKTLTGNISSLHFTLKSTSPEFIKFNMFFILTVILSCP